MSARGLPVLLLAGALASASAQPPAAADERVIETQRVVVKVAVDPAHQEYAYAFVDHQDGAPVLLDSVLAERGYLGVTLLELTPELRRHFGATEAAGVMISRVEPDSPASRAGLRAGDILTAIDGQPTASANSVVRRIAEGGDGQTVELAIRRDRSGLTIRATLATRERKQLDLGGLLWLPGRRGQTAVFELERGSVPLIELDPETMGRALSLMRERFEGDEWRERLARAGGDREALERRIRELEQRLRELERQLGELPE